MRVIQAALSFALLAACAPMMSMMHHHDAAAAPPPPPPTTSSPVPATAPAPSIGVGRELGAPPAQPAPVQSVRGEVTSVSGSQVSVRTADGQAQSFTIAPDAWIVKGRPIDASQIHAGDFVATANTNNADGTGTSTELRVFPPGMRLGEGSYPMTQPNTTMTNATVAQVVNTNGARQLTVTYAANESQHSSAGTRTITLPASVQVIQWYRVQPADIHVGDSVRGRAHADASGALVADFVFAQDAAPSAPAPH